MSAGKDENWIVVCVGCLRIQRNGRWTIDRARTLEGTSSGFCDECARAERLKHEKL